MKYLKVIIVSFITIFSVNNTFAQNGFGWNKSESKEGNTDPESYMVLVTGKCNANEFTKDVWEFSGIVLDKDGKRTNVLKNFVVYKSDASAPKSGSFKSPGKGQGDSDERITGNLWKTLMGITKSGKYMTIKDSLGDTKDVRYDVVEIDNETKDLTYGSIVLIIKPLTESHVESLVMNRADKMLSQIDEIIAELDTLDSKRAESVVNNLKETKVLLRLVKKGIIPPEEVPDLKKLKERLLEKMSDYYYPAIYFPSKEAKLEKFKAFYNYGKSPEQ